MATGGEGSSGLRGKGGRGRRSRREELLTVVSLNVNGMNDRGKRKEVVDIFERGRTDVLGVIETHLKGCGVKGGRDEDEEGLWEGLEGGVVWIGIEKGRGKERCATMIFPRVWEGIHGHDLIGSRVVWMTGKIAMVKCAFVCVYAPVNEKGLKGKMKLEKFWEDLGQLLKKFENVRGVFVLGDMNARVGSTEIGGVIGKYGVDRMNENGQYVPC